MIVNKGITAEEVLPLKRRLDESSTGLMGARCLEDDMEEGKVNEKKSGDNMSEDKNSKNNIRNLKGMKGNEENAWSSPKEKCREK